MQKHIGESVEIRITQGGQPVLIAIADGVVIEVYLSPADAERMGRGLIEAASQAQARTRSN
jgi:hypothetical protein